MSYSFNKRNPLAEQFARDLAKTPPRKMKFPTIEERSKEIQTDAIYEPDKITVKDITSMKLPDVKITYITLDERIENAKNKDFDITSFIKSLEGYKNLENAFYGYEQFISKVKELEMKMKETTHLFEKEAIDKAIAKGVIESIPDDIKKHLLICGSENLTTINNYLHKLNENRQIDSYANIIYLSILYKLGMEGILTDRYPNTLKIWGMDDAKTKYITQTLKSFIKDVSRVSKYMYGDDLAKTVDSFVIETIPDEIKLMIPEMKDMFMYKFKNHIPSDWNGSFKLLIELMESIEKHSITKCAVKTIDSNIELFRERETKAVQRFTEVVNGYEQEIANKNQDIKRLQNTYKSLRSRIDQMETEQKKLAIAYEDARIEAANQSMMNTCSPKPIPELKTSYNNGQGTTFGAGISSRGWNTGISHDFGNGWSISGGISGCW